MGTRPGAIDWTQLIIYDGVTIPLNQWLGLVYKSNSDQELARILGTLGLEASKTAVRRARQRYGYAKIPGQGVMQESGPLGALALTESKDADLPKLASLDVENEHELLKKKVLAAIKDKNVTLKELSRKFDRSDATVRLLLDELKADGFNIVGEQEARLETKAAPSIDVGQVMPTPLVEMTGHCALWAVMTDLHAGSISMQATNWIAFVNYAYSQGVRHMFIPGDLFAGHNVYKGQLNDLFAVGADKQLIVLSMLLPKLEGLTYYVIGGNHDFSFVRLGGADLVRVFAQARDDVVYLGYDVADIALTDRASARLWHMTGGRAYAISYRLQRAIEQFSFEELMNVIVGLKDNPTLRYVLAGHLHAAFWSIFGPITGLQAGAFEGQTSLTKRKGWWSIIGGFIVETWFTDGGLIQREKIEWVPGLEVPLDYLNYPDVLAAVGAGPQPEEPDIIFTWDKNGD